MELKGENANDTKVSEIMTSDVITVSCNQPLEECMALMIDKNIRHLPVYDDKELMGFLSVRDVLREDDRSAADHAFSTGALHHRRRTMIPLVSF